METVTVSLKNRHELSGRMLNLSHTYTHTQATTLIITTMLPERMGLLLIFLTLMVFKR